MCLQNEPQAAAHANSFGLDARVLIALGQW